MHVPPFHEVLGIVPLRRDQGEAELALDLEPRLCNRRGVAHGGVIATLLDSALGAAVISAIPPEWWCATTTLTTQFLAGPTGGRLTARGRVVRRGSRIAFAVGEVLDDRGRIVATASGSWHLWPYRPGSVTRTAPESPAWVAMRDDGQRLPVGKIVAVGRNYAEHVAEMGAPADRPPVFFLKPPGALAHDGDTVVLPADGGEVHHEVELVAVVGRRGRRIAPEDGLEHVLGFAVGLDLTLRAVQSEAKQRGEPWSLSKGFDGSAPVSSVVTRDLVGDGSGLEIRLRVNGESRQAANTSQMIRGVGELIAGASRWMTLERGDLLFTGTPAGVGPLRPGDRAQAEIEKVGSLGIHAAAERPTAGDDDERTDGERSSP